MVHPVSGRVRFVILAAATFLFIAPSHAKSSSSVQSDVGRGTCSDCSEKTADTSQSSHREQAAGTSANLPVLGWMFDTSNYPPRWHCGTWSPTVGWLHIVSDIAIFAAYTAIPCVLAFFVLRRKDVPFLPIFWLFAAFILCCGFGHLLEAIIFWHPVYQFSGTVKLCTAIVSWATVIALIPIVPKALAQPGLAEMNRQLHAEIQRRTASDQRLKERASELERKNEELERFATNVMHREDRVIQLKEEINRLALELGREPAYLQEASP